ncbi:MAG: type II secretion system protein [bacterium]
MSIKKAFTFIETITVMGIIAILFSLSAPQLFRLRDRNTLQTSSTKLISLIRQQQINAMNSPKLYGVYFEQSKYTLFTGSTYSSIDPTNTINTLDYPLQFTSIQFPFSQIIFSTGSGEIVSFDSNNHSFILEDVLNHDQTTVQFNALGVPVKIQ